MKQDLFAIYGLWSQILMCLIVVILSGIVIMLCIIIAKDKEQQSQGSNIYKYIRKFCTPEYLSDEELMKNLRIQIRERYNMTPHEAETAVIKAYVFDKRYFIDRYDNPQLKEA